MKIQVSSEVGAPQGGVFALHADISNWANHMSGISEIAMMADGPVGVGSRFRETRVIFGKESSEEMEVTAFDPPNTFVCEAESCGARYRTELQVVPEGDARCRVEYSFDSRPVTLFARLMTPLGALFKRPMVKMVRQDLAEMKAVAEGRAHC